MPCEGRGRAWEEQSVERHEAGVCLAARTQAERAGAEMRVSCLAPSRPEGDLGALWLL